MDYEVLLPFAGCVCFMFYKVSYHDWCSMCYSSFGGATINEVDVNEGEDEENQLLLINEDNNQDDGGDLADRLLNPEQYSDSDEDISI